MFWVSVATRESFSNAAIPRPPSPPFRPTYFQGFTLFAIWHHDATCYKPLLKERLLNFFSFLLACSFFFRSMWTQAFSLSDALRIVLFLWLKRLVFEIVSRYTQSADTHSQQIHTVSRHTQSADTHSQQIHTADTHSQQKHTVSRHTQPADTHSQQIHTVSRYTQSADIQSADTHCQQILTVSRYTQSHTTVCSL
jgi:hypothetical protein